MMGVVAIGTVGALADLGNICLHVASLWPHPPMVVEADPDGGRLAVRHNWDLRPGLADLVVALNSPSSGIRVDGSIRRLRNGVRVVVGPPALEAMSASIADLSRSLVALESSTTSDVLIDVGIIRPDSPAREIVAGASRRIVVVRKDVEDLVALAHRQGVLDAFGDWSVLTAGGRLRTDEAAHAIHWPILADLLPHDRKSSALLRTALATFSERPVATRGRLFV